MLWGDLFCDILNWFGLVLYISARLSPVSNFAPGKTREKGGNMNANANLDLHSYRGGGMDGSLRIVGSGDSGSLSVAGAGADGT